MTTSAFDPSGLVARDLRLAETRVTAVLTLLDGGATVPFLARYRKEATGGLDEVQIRAIEERRDHHRDLHERRDVIVRSLEEQDKLTPGLRLALFSVTTKAELEDLYLPFRPKRRTKALIARERGLLPLAERILEQPRSGDPRSESTRFLDAEKGVPTGEDALSGARDIVAEIVAERAEVRALVRRAMAEAGEIVTSPVKAKTKEPTKFEQYYDFREPARTIPSHRYLAICRGETEGVIRVRIDLDAEPILLQIEVKMQRVPRSPFSSELALAIRDAYKRLLFPSVEGDVRAEVKRRSDLIAIDVFAANLKNLLLAPPLGGKAVLGIDPGLRTGSKCVAVDETGRYLDHVTLFLTQGDKAELRSQREFEAFLATHNPIAVGVGNGTGSRETERFVRNLLTERKKKDIVVVSVSESGASVYSASDLARDEFPDLDITIRGAISIARRLQDPLSELVKIEPKSIGVGQYQHDVSPALLEAKLDDVVEECVNRVGVDLNTASAPLLARVSGIGPALAKKVLAHRNSHGPFRAREALLEVAGLGKRTFEQAAGFLRVHAGVQPLDASAVHPERYPVVVRIARDLAIPLRDLIGNTAVIDRIDTRRYLSDEVGEPTLADIVSELKRPGRDPRKEFEPPRFSEQITTLDDLKEGMVLEGVVTNVTAFGAFVDIGVHQDGLVHISQLADRFVRDPSEVVHAGDRIQVRVLAVDLARKRISLSAKSKQQG